MLNSFVFLTDCALYGIMREL